MPDRFGGDRTGSFQNIRCYDQLKVNAVLHWIDGKTHLVRAPVDRPMERFATSPRCTHLERVILPFGHPDVASALVQVEEDSVAADR